MEQLETSQLSELSSNKVDCFKELKHLHLKCPKNITMAYININFIRNKFDNFSSLISDKVDVLVIAETKIDSSFPASQFTINGFKKPYRLDVSGNSGGILVYIRDDLISRQLDVLSTHPDIQVVPFELNVRKQKSSPRNIHVGVPQGSVLGPMPFNIFINDLFLISLDSEICNFADDNTIFSCGHELHEIVTVLENDLSILLEWFTCNDMVVNPKKF